MNDMMGMTEYLILNERIEEGPEGSRRYFLDVHGPQGMETWDVESSLWEQIGQGDVVRHSDAEGFWLFVG